jgi:hypothetical protein
MLLQLRRHENILFPMPYMESEPHPFIVTNQRLVQTIAGIARELPTAEVEGVVRGQARPLLPVGLALILFGLPLIGYGAFLLYGCWGMRAAPLSALWEDDRVPDAVEGTDPRREQMAPGAEDAVPESEDPPNPQDRNTWPTEVLRTRLIGQATLGGGLVLALVGWRLIKRRRFFILCQGRGVIMKVRAQSENQQTQMLMTVQAALG